MISKMLNSFLDDSWLISPTLGNMLCDIRPFLLIEFSSLLTGLIIIMALLAVGVGIYFSTGISTDNGNFVSFLGLDGIEFETVVHSGKQLERTIFTCFWHFD